VAPPEAVAETVTPVTPNVTSPEVIPGGAVKTPTAARVEIASDVGFTSTVGVPKPYVSLAPAERSPVTQLPVAKAELL